MVDSQSNNREHVTVDHFIDESERNWESILCLIFGHEDYPDVTWEVTNDASHRKLHGDICQRCHRFQPRKDARERFDGEDMDDHR